MQSRNRMCLVVLLAGVFTVLGLAEASQAQMIGPGFARRFPGRGGAQAAPLMKDATGIHLARNRQVPLQPQQLTDGGGFRWDIYQNCNIQTGTNNAYSGGLNPQINNNGFGSNGQAFASKDNDEFEIGPYNVSNVTYSRRVKVYKDAALARWIDIFENPSNAEITVNFAVYSSFCWQVASTKYSSGKNTFGEDDWALITNVQGNPGVPSLLHIVCDKKSKVRPSIQVQGNTLWVRYTFRIPANGSAALCYF